MSEAPAVRLPAARLLRLRACDADDLKAIAAVVQDALVPVHDMRFQATESRFVLAMNRFRWECDPTGQQTFERINSGISFDSVSQVQLRGFEQSERDFILDLLTITYEQPFVTLSFAGYRDVRLKTATLECRLDDFGEPWPARSRPSHKGEDGQWTEWAK